MVLCLRDELFDLGFESVAFRLVLGLAHGVLLGKARDAFLCRQALVVNNTVFVLESRFVVGEKVGWLRDRNRLDQVDILLLVC